jgi:Tfp pilus assembly protein PilE
MSRITPRETVRELLALLGQVGFRLAQAAAVTVGVVMVLGFFVVKSMCGCSTKEKAYQAAMKSDLRNLMTAQEVYFADHGTFAGSLEAFGENQYWQSTGVSVRIEEATDGGWKATATHSAISKRCALFVGDVAPPVKEAVEGEPRCWEP